MAVSLENTFMGLQPHLSPLWRSSNRRSWFSRMLWHFCLMKPSFFFVFQRLIPHQGYSQPQSPELNQALSPLLTKCIPQDAWCGGGERSRISTLGKLPMFDRKITANGHQWLGRYRGLLERLPFGWPVRLWLFHHTTFVFEDQVFFKRKVWTNIKTYCIFVQRQNFILSYLCRISECRKFWFSALIRLLIFSVRPGLTWLLRHHEYTT